MKTHEQIITEVCDCKIIYFTTQSEYYNVFKHAWCASCKFRAKNNRSCPLLFEGSKAPMSVAAIDRQRADKIFRKHPDCGIACTAFVRVGGSPGPTEKRLSELEKKRKNMEV